MKTHAPPIAERIPHPVQRSSASRNGRQGGQISQLRALIERSPVMLTQRRACAAIQREQAGAKPRPDTVKLLRVEHLLAALQQKHADGLLDQFAGGTVPDALSEADSVGTAWSFYTDILADAVCEPAAALSAIGDSEAEEGAAVCEGLAALSARIRGLRGLGDPAAIASAASEIRSDIARLRQQFAALLASKRNRRGDEAWDSIKKPTSGTPPAPEPETTAPPAKEAKPGEQASAS
jgi:hypothetical protein